MTETEPTLLQSKPVEPKGFVATVKSDISSFRFKSYPSDANVFNILIIAKNADVLTKNLLMYIINSFYLNKATKLDNYILNKYRAVPAKEERESTLGIFDMSSEHMFSGLHDNITTLDKSLPDWLRNYTIKNIMYPGLMRRADGTDWCENVSHNIWLYNSAEDVPSILTSLVDISIIVDHDDVVKYAHKHVGNIDSKYFESDTIFLFSKKMDIDIGTIPFKRFTQTTHT